MSTKFRVDGYRQAHRNLSLTFLQVIQTPSTERLSIFKVFVEGSNKPVYLMKITTNLVVDLETNKVWKLLKSKVAWGDSKKGLMVINSYTKQDATITLQGDQK